MVNAAMYFLFTASFGLKYYTMVVVAMERQKLADADFWRRVRDLVPSDEAAQIAVFQTFYWLNDGKLLGIYFLWCSFFFFGAEYFFLAQLFFFRLRFFFSAHVTFD